MSPSVFVAQEAGFHSNAELSNFWKHVLFTKQSDTTPKRIFEKTISIDFSTASEKRPTDFNLNSNRE